MAKRADRARARRTDRNMVRATFGVEARGLPPIVGPGLPSYKRWPSRHPIPPGPTFLPHLRRAGPRASGRTDAGRAACRWVEGRRYRLAVAFRRALVIVAPYYRHAR